MKNIFEKFPNLLSFWVYRLEETVHGMTGEPVYEADHLKFDKEMNSNEFDECLAEINSVLLNRSFHLEEDMAFFEA